MSCDKFKEMILNSILDEQSNEAGDMLQSHIQTCDDCRHEYEQLCAAVGILKSGPNESMLPVEKLRFQNRIYKAQLSRLSARNNRSVALKRLSAIAAALIFFFLGFSSRSFYQEDFGPKESVSREERIEDLIKQQISDLPGQRVSHRGFLLIAKGRKAIEEHESIK